MGRRLGANLIFPLLLAGHFLRGDMAIDKKVENEYGAEFVYHKLRDIRIVNDDKIGIQMTLTVQSWLNKQARIEGKQPTVRQCVIMNADFAMQPFYALLKAKFPEFAGGLDDMNNDFKKDRAASGDVEYIQQTAQGALIERHKDIGSQE